MSEAIPQDHALKLQLACIGGNEPSSSYFELRPLTRDGRPAARDRAFVPVRQIGEAMARIGEMAPRLNVFVGAAPRVRKDGTAAAVERAWALWADLDGRDALAKLAAFRPPPTLVIRSGSPDSAHAYWALQRPVTPQGAQRANRRLALALTADIAATDPARILRPAGTLNHKTSPPAEVHCTRCELNVFSLGDVVGNLRDDARYLPRPVPPVGQRITGDPSELLLRLVNVVRRAPVGNRNRALFWTACRAAEHNLGEQAHEELRRVGLEVGLSEHETDATIRSGLGRGPEARIVA
jgi:hypothetical protein